IVVELEKEDQERTPPRRAGMSGQVGALHDPTIPRGQHVLHQGLGVLAHVSVEQESVSERPRLKRAVSNRQKRRGLTRGRPCNKEATLRQEAWERRTRLELRNLSLEPCG